MADFSQEIGQQLAAVGTLFDEGKWAGSAQALPCFGELPGQKPAEERADGDGGVKVAPGTKGRRGTVIAEVWCVESLPHESGEGDGAFCFDPGPEPSDEFRFAKLVG